MAEVFALEGVARDYAWGSRSGVQAMLGVEPDGFPIAELWFGAHPGDPSPVADTTLDKLIASDPDAMLGADVVARFGAELPFLLKVLAADKPLSIQVHPTKAQAEAGFEHEDGLGIARDATNRNYRDRNHKPELLCALTEFEAFCGFRPVAATTQLLDALAVPALAEVQADLGRPGGLRAAFTRLITLADPAPTVEAVLRRADKVPAEFAGALAAMGFAHDEFPGDAGVLVALLLNHVRLARGEAIFLGAGNVHSYVRGIGVEIMANSDNVLRCGLTPKHVDVDEVLAITDFVELAEPRCKRGPAGFDVPVPDFRLGVLDEESDAALPAGAPQIVLCTEGAFTVGAVAVRPGGAAFVPADAGARLVGRGTAFVASAGEAVLLAS